MNKCVVATGSTSGIGLAIASAFAQAGNNVVINGFAKPEEIQVITKRLESVSKTRVLYHAADMSKPFEIADLIETAANTFGTVDVLVNNAGIQHVEKIEDFPVEMWDQIVAVNLSSSFHTMRKTIPHMKKGGKGVSSTSPPPMVLLPPLIRRPTWRLSMGSSGLPKPQHLNSLNLGSP